MNTVFFQLLNLTPFWLINYTCGLLAIYSCISKNKNFKWVAICLALKMLFKNILFDVVFMSLYGHNNWAQHLNLWYSIFSTIFVFILYKVSFKLPWEKVSVIAIISDSRALCCSIIPNITFSYLFHYDMMNHLQEAPTIYNLIIIPFAFVLAVLSQYIGRDLWKYVREKDLKHPRFWNVILIISVCWGISNSSRLDILYPYKMIAVVFVAIILFSFWLKKKNEQMLELNNRNLLLQQEMILQYYESLTEQIDLTRKMKHDIDNHMQIIKSIQDKNYIEALDSYTKDLKEQYDRLSNDCYCSNVIVNALIANKKKKCKKEKIDFKINLNEMELCNISEYDFVSILFNLLDNAIESCIKITDETKRFICLNCFVDAGQLIIYMKNGCNDKLPKSRPRFFTTKQDKKLHGIGMHIIEEIIEKYNGNLTTEQDSLCFETTINIPNGGQ